jgi:poly(beta-D-mannuronate) lyase
LKGPVDVRARQTLRGAPLPAFACAASPPLVRDLRVEEVYVDRAYSKIDPERLKQAEQAVAGLGRYTIGAVRLSDAWLRSNPPQDRVAQCLLEWLLAWARGGALLGKLETAGSQHYRKWTLAGLALAFLKIRDAPGLDPAAIAEVCGWFNALADAAEAYYATWGPGAHNNHFYWLALAMAATAVAANDRPRLLRAFRIYEEAMDAITPEGALPLELQRKARALGYHVFSLVPLVMIAEIGAVNGHDLYGSRNGAIHRLAARVQAGLTDQSWFAAATDTPQDWGGLTPFLVSWGEPYYCRFPNPQLGQMISAKRPIFYHWLGGDVTDSFGSSALPFPPR